MDIKDYTYDPSRRNPSEPKPGGDETISKMAYFPISQALVVVENSTKEHKSSICPLKMNASNSFEIDTTEIPPDFISIRRQLEILLYLRNFTDPAKLSAVMRSNLLVNLAPYLAEFNDAVPSAHDELLIDDILPVVEHDNISPLAEKNILLLRLGSVDGKSTWEQRTPLYMMDCSERIIYEHKKNVGFNPRDSNHWRFLRAITPPKI